MNEWSNNTYNFTNKIVTLTNYLKVVIDIVLPLLDGYTSYVPHTQH